MAISSGPIATGWLNENSLREYPFHEGCGLRPNDSAGAMVENGWRLPNCLIVDMSISVSGADFDPFLYLGQISIISGSVTLVFCDRDGNRVMSLFASKESHTKYDSYQISGVGSFADARGIATIGDLDEFFSEAPEGVYSFSAEETRIEPTCIKPSSAGVKTIAAVDSSGYTSLSLSGNVKLIAGENIRFDYEEENNALWISADPNSGYVEKCECDDNGQTFVQSINGIAIEDVTIEGENDNGGCVSVNTDGGVISISDNCSKPCCGCAETTFINQTINDLQTSIATLTGNLSSLGQRLELFVESYVLSRKTLQ